MAGVFESLSVVRTGVMGETVRVKQDLRFGN